VVAANAARLCDAHDAAIFQLDGDNLRLVAHTMGRSLSLVCST
jgi:hypothetical protein